MSAEQQPPTRRTQLDAINEAEGLLLETFDRLDPDNERDAWFLVRITKIREALADRVDAVGEWISVKDRLPEEGRRVLVSSPEYDEIEVGAFWADHWNAYDLYGIEYDVEVTHWMPLPDPPAKEREASR